MCGKPLSKPGQKYCNRECWKNFTATRTMRACDVCGKQYKPGRSDKLQRTCGRICGVELRRRDIPAKPKQLKWIFILRCKRCAEWFSTPRRRQRTCNRTCLPKRICLCGQVIEKFCRSCPDCSAHRRKQSRKEAGKRYKRRNRNKRKRPGITTEPYTLAYVAKRDRYRCGFCGKRVAMTQVVPHPKAPTIDHIVPLAHGGDDTRANVQLAHFICNSIAGDRGTKQPALFG
jgi:HNH endonuclease